MLIQAMEHQKEKQPEGEQAVNIGDGIEQNARKERPIYDGNIGDDSPLRDGDQYASDGYARLLGCKSDSEGNGGANGDADGDADAEDEWKALTAKEIANMDLHHCRKHLAASQCPHDYIMCKDEDPTCLVRSILQLATS